MVRRPGFWAAFTLASVVAAIFAMRLFPQAFPIVHLDLTMDREGALAAAREVAARHRVGPSTYREAASFRTDTEAQTFVELAGGGKEAFANMLRQNLYAPYTWQVRHFQEGQKYEALLRFRPDGVPYGFLERLEETAPGAALRPDEARAVAERAATTAWQLDLEPYALVEHSREERPTGRVDHTFTYERAAPTLNEGRYRVRLVVTGDRLTELTHFIRVPQAFSRRYEEMRAANQAIGVAGSIGMVVLYVIGGIGVGLFFLLRQRWVVARPAIWWGVGIAFLQFLAGLNSWPLLWMSYDTALPRTSFITQQLTSLVGAFAGFATLFAFSFMAAESLTRRAFGHHPQFWRLWSRDAASSRAVLGRTVAGYLMVSLFFAYEVILYFAATHWWGWWTPSEALIHPDILATYVPWLSALANSLQAGFWEEALFRAVPIAGAALIGDRVGRRGLFIAIAFVVQTIVFGAGHAPYPTQPSYARPVELILPSIAFGLMYLRYGLLPAIVLHFAFDVVWMALPLFVSNADGIWFDRAAVIVLTLVPLWVVLAARLRTGRWQDLPDQLRNDRWTPEPAREHTQSQAHAPVIAPLTPKTTRAWMAAGVLALGLWIAVPPARVETPALEPSRNEAAAIAREALAALGATLGSSWRVMPVVDSGRSEAHQFVWDADRQRFGGLLGRYLGQPRWRVRVATFEGDIDTRTEEWTVLVNARGEAERVVHQVPESRPGASLNEDQARNMAIEAVERVLGLPAASLREVSAQPMKLAARTDWNFAFQDTTVPPIVYAGGGPAADGGESRGDARIEVAVAGEEVVRVRPVLHVPDAWQRQQRANSTFAQIVGSLATLVAGGALVTAAVTGIIGWSRRRGFSRRVMVAVFGVFAVASTLTQLNRVPVTLASLSTAQPFELQVAMLAAGALLGILLPSVVLALAAGSVPYDAPRRRLIESREAWAVGAALGVLLVTAGSLVRLAGPPLWPDLTALSTYVPFVAWPIEPVPALFLRAITMLALLILVDDYTNGWTERRLLFGVLLVVAGALLGAPSSGLAPGEWAVAGLTTGLVLLGVYVLILRHDLLLVVPAMGVALALSTAREAAQASSWSVSVGTTLGALVVLSCAWWLFQMLNAARAAETAAVGEH
jgi:hypothetical protein